MLSAGYNLKAIILSRTKKGFVSIMKNFGDFEFDETSMKLTRASQKVKLTGQALGLLILLIERPAELVTREEIQRSLWPNRRVEFEHSIDVVLNRLRKALGDNGKDSDYIQTVPRSGYRFIKEVKSEGIRAHVVARDGWIRALKTYAAIAFLAGAVVFLILHTRYDKAVRTHTPPTLRGEQAR